MDTAELASLVMKTANLALEERKALDACLRAKESEVRMSESPVKDGELDTSVWNDLGMYFLNNVMAAEAVIVYSHMLSEAQSLEGKNTAISTRASRSITLVLHRSILETTVDVTDRLTAY